MSTSRPHQLLSPSLCGIEGLANSEPEALTSPPNLSLQHHNPFTNFTQKIDMSYDPLQKMSLRVCTKCESIFPSATKACPACQSKNTSSFMGQSFVYIAGLIVITLICVGINPTFGGVVAVLAVIAIPFLYKDLRNKFNEAQMRGGYLISPKGEKLKTKSVRIKNQNPQTTTPPDTIHQNLYSHPDFTEENDAGDDLQDFRDSLSIIWTDDQSEDLLSLQFSYVDFHRDRSKRLIDLSEVSINSNNKLYLTGYCYDADDDRTFKFSRISATIECNDRSYSKKDFLRKVLDIDPVKYN